MAFAQDTEANLAILEAMAAEYKDYLLADELFRQVVVQTPERTYMPKMTIGLMLEQIHAIEGEYAQMVPEGRIRFEEAVALFEAARDEYPDAYGDKLRLEMKSHLDSWGWYLDGCDHGEEDCPDDYPSEVWLRTRLEELLQAARSGGIRVDEAVERLHKLDRTLDDMFQRGAYIGPAGYSAEFPQDRYWWLYGRPIVGTAP
jgi:hypothetical protein